MASQTMDAPGRRLGDFELRERIGTGGMGAVYRAWQRGMERDVAIKILPPAMARDEVLLKRFYQEARSAAKVDHPNMVRAIAVGEQDGMHYFAMEYVDGETLNRRVVDGGPLREDEAVHVIAAVTEAVAVAHRCGMVHRDIKPENVMLTRDGRVKLADLGLVKRLDLDLGLTQSGKGLGTTPYMAPEQFVDAKHADLRCDIYSLGATLYFAVTGTVPFAKLSEMEAYQRKRRGDLPAARTANPQISARLATVIERAMQPKPADRYATCAEFLADLVVEGGAAEPDPYDTPTRGEVDLAAASPPLRGRGGPGTAPATTGRASAAAPQRGQWVVRFFEGNQRRQLCLRTEEVRQGLKSGRLASDIRVARSEQGPFLHVNAFNEFTDLVAQLKRDRQTKDMQQEVERTVAALHAGAPLRSRSRTWPVLIVCGSLVLAGGATLIVWLMRH